MSGAWGGLAPGCASLRVAELRRAADRHGGRASSLVHSISLPPGEYGGDAIERLFTNRLDWDAHPYYEQIRGLEVSAHFLVRRDGELVQFVSCDERAWHAGRSAWHGRASCNDYSIGIELEGLEGATFEAAQYARAGDAHRGPARRAIRSQRSPATSTSRRAASTTRAPASTGPRLGAPDSKGRRRCRPACRNRVARRLERPVTSRVCILHGRHRVVTLYRSA